MSSQMEDFFNPLPHISQLSPLTLQSSSKIIHLLIIPIFLSIFFFMNLFWFWYLSYVGSSEKRVLTTEIATVVNSKFSALII